MILDLTPNEATVLHIILERIAGYNNTGRQHAESLLRKLKAAGETYSIEKEALFPVDEDAGNRITFK